MKKLRIPIDQLQYRIQGQYELGVDGRILVSRVCGPWNFQAVKGYREAADEIIKTLSGAPWVVLAEISGEPLHTAESIDELAKIICSHRGLGRCGTALVYEGESAIARIHQLMLSRMYIMSGEPYYFAENETDALAWLGQRLAEEMSSDKFKP